MNKYFEDVSTFILAGGQSRRMNQDKAQMKVQGIPMIKRIVTEVDGLTNSTALITQPFGKYSFLNLPTYYDLRKECGPLAGIESALTSCKTQFALIIACDLPFISKEFLQLLLSCRKKAEAIVPECWDKKERKLQGLCAVYSVKILSRITAELDIENYQIKSFLKKVSQYKLRFEEYSKLPNAEKILSNINTPSDYQELLNSIVIK